MTVRSDRSPIARRAHGKREVGDPRPDSSDDRQLEGERGQHHRPNHRCLSGHGPEARTRMRGRRAGGPSTIRGLPRGRRPSDRPNQADAPVKKTVEIAPRHRHPVMALRHRSPLTPAPVSASVAATATATPPYYATHSSPIVKGRYQRVRGPSPRWPHGLVAVTSLAGCGPGAEAGSPCSHDRPDPDDSCSPGHDQVAVSRPGDGICRERTILAGNVDVGTLQREAILTNPRLVGQRADELTDGPQTGGALSRRSRRQRRPDRERGAALPRCEARGASMAGRGDRCAALPGWVYGEVVWGTTGSPRRPRSPVLR
jgi:hypothetical protein